MIVEVGLERSTVRTAPRTVAQNATDCTDGTSNGEVPTGELVSAGGLSFPRDVAPSWDLVADEDMPNSIDAVALSDTVFYDESKDLGWEANLTVGSTNFVQSLSLADQAQLMLTCLVSDSYAGASPTVAAATSTPGRLDGVPTATIEAAVSAVTIDPTITGDDVVLTIVGTQPSSYFLAETPFEDAGRRAMADAARRGLHVASV